MAAELLPLPARALPTSIGRYDIVGLLGQGGMAHVYLALQRGAFASEKLVVIKQLRPEFAADDAFLAMFVDEARIALQLNHPNVVHTYEVVAEHPEFFLAMEFLEGQTLAQVVRKTGQRGFPTNLQIWILIQVLSGLQYAHTLRALDGSPLYIVHRDVSPSNVLVTSSGEVKLLDFGIAKAAGAMSFTQQGVVKGKLGYVAPEQCLARPSDARADLFAVGVMLWEAIAGRRRIAAETSAAAFEARVKDREPAIEDVVKDVPPRLAEICRRALAHDPEQRFATAAAFKSELEDYLATKDPGAGPAKVAAEMKRLFGDEFAALRASIKKFVQESRLPSTKRPPVEPDPAQAGVTDFTRLALRVRPTRKAALLALLAGVAAAAVGFAVSFAMRSPPAASQAAFVPSLSESASAEAKVVTRAPAPPQAAALPKIVHVTIAAKPKRSQLVLDGRPVSNPFVAELPPDDRDHELLAQASGYRSERKLLHLSRDLELALALEPEDKRPRAPRAANDNPALVVTAERSAPLPLPAARPRASSAAPVPGQELTTQPRAAHAIDEKDPYQ